MQFHLDGYNPGDPAKAPPKSAVTDVDVLIVGCGPAGLTLASQMAAFPAIRTRIIDTKPGPLQVGQADGIACRTVEMFHAFGFAERVLREAYWVNETTFWKPGEPGGPALVRGGRIQDTEDGLSECPHVILNQARVHDFYLDVMRDGPAHLEPDYDTTFVGLKVGAEAVAVQLEQTAGPRKGQVDTVRARYVVGCDGARSGVRRALGRALTGESANQAWGVMDVLAVTDFPDIRLKTAIHSADEGSLLIIPREGGYLVRMYIEMDKLGAGERVAERAVTVEQLIAAAGRILQPYTLEVKEVAWWSVYEIGQRMCDGFDDLPNGGAGNPRVFIAGDACHTHSPKAGQGMNVSMQDGFNLGWKLAAVLSGRSPPAILRSYSAERHAVAAELISFDREIAKMFSAKPRRPGDPSGEGVDPAEFQRYFTQQGRFTAGTATHYTPSALTAEPRHQALASGFVVGMRLHSAPVIRLADAKPMQLGHAMLADGRWRILLFADAADPSARLDAACAWIGETLVPRYTPPGADMDAAFDVRAVLQADHREAGPVPALLRPRKGRFGLTDYEKVFCPDGRAGDIFAMRGVSRDGCILVVRPDQYVAHLLPLDGFAELAAFFSPILIEANRSGCGSDHMAFDPPSRRA